MNVRGFCDPDHLRSPRVGMSIPSRRLDNMGNKAALMKDERLATKRPAAILAEDDNDTR